MGMRRHVDIPESSEKQFQKSAKYPNVHQQDSELDKEVMSQCGSWEIKTPHTHTHH